MCARIWLTRNAWWAPKPAVERLAQGWHLLAQRAPGEIGQRVRIGGAPDQRVEAETALRWRPARDFFLGCSRREERVGV
jgi:hypothetical protein